MSKNENNLYKEENEKAKNNLISFYLNFKNYTKNKIINKKNSKGDELIQNEKKELTKLSLLKLIDFIKLSMERLASTKVEEELKILKKELNDLSENQNICWKYEELLIKEEASIRKHISYNQQLKIEIDKLNESIFEKQLENKKIKEINVI